MRSRHHSCTNADSRSGRGSPVGRWPETRLSSSSCSRSTLRGSLTAGPLVAPAFEGAGRRPRDTSAVRGRNQNPAGGVPHTGGKILRRPSERRMSSENVQAKSPTISTRTNIENAHPAANEPAGLGRALALSDRSRCRRGPLSEDGVDAALSRQAFGVEIADPLVV